MSSPADIEALKYPIGKYNKANEYNSTIINSWIAEIEKLPSDLKKTVTGLTEEQLNTQYRPDGWTARQVVHHIADSHIVAYIRFKLTLTEETPAINPYKEDMWAEMKDASLPVDISIHLISNIHLRWLAILKAMNTGDFDKAFFHAEYKRNITLKEILGLYAWHGKHHLAQITALIKRRGW